MAKIKAKNKNKKKLQESTRYKGPVLSAARVHDSAHPMVSCSSRMYGPRQERNAHHRGALRTRQGGQGRQGRAGAKAKEMALNFHIIGVLLRHHTFACSEWLHTSNLSVPSLGVSCAYGERVCPLGFPLAVRHVPLCSFSDRVRLHLIIVLCYVASDQGFVCHVLITLHAVSFKWPSPRVCTL